MRYVALLRGIHPGSPRMRNEHLRRVVEGLGHTDVATVISSGNVVFASTIRSRTRLESSLEAAWPEQLGFTSTTIVRSRTDLRRLADNDPFDGAALDTKGLQVTFLKQEPSERPHTPLVPAGERFTIVAMDHSTICTVADPSDPGTPDVMRWIERRFGPGITTRSWATVNRILTAFG